MRYYSEATQNAEVEIVFFFLDIQTIGRFDAADIEYDKRSILMHRDDTI